MKTKMEPVDRIRNLMLRQGIPCIELVFYTKENCRLCHKMKTVIQKVAQNLPISLEERDITQNGKWWDLYRYEIPVLAFRDRVLFRHRLSTRPFLAALEELLESLSFS